MVLRPKNNGPQELLDQSKYSGVFCFRSKSCHYHPRTFLRLPGLVAVHLCFGDKPRAYLVIYGKDNPDSNLVQYPLEHSCCSSNNTAVCVATPRSSSGLGRRPLTAVTRVRIPYGVLRLLSSVGQSIALVMRGSSVRI